MTPITFSIPIRTVSESNARQHWAQKAKRAKAQRQAVTLCARAAGHKECPCGKCVQWLETMAVTRGGTHFEAPRMWVTLTRIAPRELDTDNLSRSFKAIRDQVAAHLGIDDRSKDVAWCYAQQKGKPNEYRVDIAVREAASHEVRPVTP